MLGSIRHRAEHIAARALSRVPEAGRVRRRTAFAGSGVLLACGFSGLTVSRTMAAVVAIVGLVVLASVASFIGYTTRVVAEFDRRAPAQLAQWLHVLLGAVPEERSTTLYLTMLMAQEVGPTGTEPRRWVANDASSVRRFFEGEVEELDDWVDRISARWNARFPSEDEREHQLEALRTRASNLTAEERDALVLEYATGLMPWVMPLSLSSWMAVGARLRLAGPALLAVGFVIAWTLGFMGLWAATPTALKDIGSAAHIGDFIYLAVSGAVGNVPPDITPTSQAAHMLVASEFASGAVLIGAYATAVISAAGSRGPEPLNAASQASG